MENREENRQLYTKGDRDTVVKRCESVHTITMFCPILDEGIKLFRTEVFESLSPYIKDNRLENVPVMDVFMCFMDTLNFCKLHGIDFNNLYSFWGLVQSFQNLHYINLEFSDDENLLNAYEYIRTSKDKSKSFDMVKLTYKVDVVELVLNNMFTQNVIDMINKVMMFDEILPNSYLDREFLSIFEFDYYINFMEMFCSNMGRELNELDTNIVDYLVLFPKIISDCKPNIRILTNYSDL